MSENNNLKHIITLFCGAGAKTYAVQNAESLKDAMTSALSDFRMHFHLFHLPEDGIGKMSATSNCTPPNCHVIDMAF